MDAHANASKLPLFRLDKETTGEFDKKNERE
jgi:hypothetical protein